VIRQMKKRYLALKIESEESLEEEEVRDAVWNGITRLFGEYGASQAGLFFVEYDKKKKHAVLRCWLKALPIVHASIASITKIKDKTATFHVSKISGNLRAVSKKSCS